MLQRTVLFVPFSLSTEVNILQMLLQKYRLFPLFVKANLAKSRFSTSLLLLLFVIMKLFTVEIYPGQNYSIAENLKNRLSGVK